MFKHPLFHYLPIFLIFCLAFGLRVIALGSMPLRLHQDEIMNGYVGRYILLNGKDVHGNHWPILYFDNFGDYPNVIPMYISGAFTFIFGVNEFAIRFPIAVLGALAVLPIYAIVKLITDDEKSSLFAGLAITILPWHIVLSRATAEAVMGSTAFLFGLYLLLRAVKSKTINNFLFSLPLFLLTYFLYPSFRTMVPLTFLAALFLTNEKLRKVIFAGMVIFLLITAAISRTPWGSGRFKQTSIFSFNGQSNARATNSAYAAGQNKILFVRIFNNKIVIYTREFVRQYLSYFSFNYLFTDGGHPNRYLVPDQGLLYYSFGIIPLLFFVIIYLDPNKLKAAKPLNKQVVTFLLFLLLLAPLASALTLDEVPNVHRSGAESVMLIFPIAFAFHYIRKVKYGKFALAPLLLIAISIEGIYFLNQYFIQAPQAESVERYDERTDLAKWIIANHNNYDNIYVTREIFPIYVLFYSNNFSPDLAGKFVNPLIIPQVDNIHFIDNNCPTLVRATPKTGNIIIIDKAECKSDPDSGLVLIQNIYRSNGTLAYKLFGFPNPIRKKK